MQWKLLPKELGCVCARAAMQVTQPLWPQIRCISLLSLPTCVCSNFTHFRRSLEWLAPTIRKYWVRCSADAEALNSWNCMSFRFAALAIIKMNPLYYQNHRCRHASRRQEEESQLIITFICINIRARYANIVQMSQKACNWVVQSRSGTVPLV